MSDDLHSLARDLSAAPRKAQRNVLGAVEHAAVNVKDGWKRNARRSAGRHARSYPNSITYSMMSIGSALRGTISAEVGPDKGRPQGALGNLIEFGSVNNPPYNDGGRALRAEEPKLERAIAEATLNALGWR